MNAAHATSPTRQLDVRGREPAAQMEGVMLELTLLRPGQRLCATLDHEPYPLYRMLDQNGYAHSTHVRTDARFDLLIWKAAD